MVSWLSCEESLCILYGGWLSYYSKQCSYQWDTFFDEESPWQLIMLHKEITLQVGTKKQIPPRIE